MRLMHMRVGLVAVVIGLAVAGCTTGPAGVGTISGAGSPCVGPAPTPKNYVMTIKVEQGGKVVATARAVGPDYRFFFTLPSGRYVVTSSGDFPAKSVVHRGKTSTVNLAAGCT